VQSRCAADAGSAGSQQLTAAPRPTVLARAGGASTSALNGFRVSADALHVLSASSLLAGLLRHRSAFSVSVRTQELYMLVFITRYLDLRASLQYL
jgi:hypothetical protein